MIVSEARWQQQRFDAAQACGIDLPAEMAGTVSGPEGGYRLASDQPLAPLTLDADDALKLYVVSLLDWRSPSEQDSSVPELGNPYSREALKLKLTMRIKGKAEPLITIAKPYLQGAGIQLELLTGPLTGIYDPNGMGSMLVAILAVGV